MWRACIVLILAVQAWGTHRTLNISRDLVRLGIANRNAVPDRRNWDAAVPLRAAIGYALTHGVTQIVADRGAYYFTSRQSPNRYIALRHAHDLALDFAGSQLYFADSYVTAFDLVDCRRVTLGNFTLDFQHLPFTQVRLLSVGPATRALKYVVEPEFRNPIELAASGELWALAFRNGSLVPGTNRLPIERISSDTELRTTLTDAPWAQATALERLGAGDTIVITARGGPAVLRAENSEQVTFRNVVIHAAGSLAIQMDRTRNSVVDSVHVIPAAGRWISSNADGIHVSYAGAGNRVINNAIRGTMDDGIALNSQFLAFVERADGRRITVRRVFESPIPNGTAISFVDPTTGLLHGRTTVAIQTGESLTLSSAVPELKSGWGIVPANMTERGDGTVISGNTVEDVFSARGIFLSGVSGVRVERNKVSRTGAGGIVVHQDLAAYPAPPSDDINITANTLDRAVRPVMGAGAVAGLGAIFALATDTSFAPLPVPTLSRIRVTGNRIVDPGRTAIWLGNTRDAVVSDNVIEVRGPREDVLLWGIHEKWASQLRRDAHHNVVIR